MLVKIDEKGGDVYDITYFNVYGFQSTLQASPFAFVKLILEQKNMSYFYKVNYSNICQTIYFTK